jgi:hypothetical protein
MAKVSHGEAQLGMAKAKPGNVVQSKGKAPSCCAKQRQRAVPWRKALATHRHAMHSKGIAD